MRRGAALTAGLVTLTVVGVTGLATTYALDAAERLDSARRHLLELRGGEATADTAVVALRRADEDLAAASAVLSRWPVDALAAVPLLGRSWAAERATARSAGEVVGATRLLVECLPSLAAGPGGVDLAALADVRADFAGPARRSAQAYDDLLEQPLGLTPPPVVDGVTSARDALGPAVAALQQADRGLAVVSSLLGASGPRSVLVMLQNNAELRGTGGYTASFATGTTQGGRLSLGPLQDLVEVADPPQEDHYVAAPEEYAQDFQMYGGNSTMWRTWNMSPHVPDSALVGARIAGDVLGREPDVLVLLDVPAMSALASLGTTVITLPDGSSVEPSELTEALLVDSYAAAGRDGQAQVRRRLQLQAAASAALGRLLTGQVPAADLARMLVQLAEQRHLSVWSARAEDQQALEALGVAGALLPPDGGDLAHVSVNNIGANKLDLYVERELSIAAEVGPTSARVTQTVRFTNSAPPGLVPYVAGVTRPGVAVSRVEFSLPPTARGVVATVDGRQGGTVLHTGPDRWRVIARQELPRGASSLFQVRYTVPVFDGRYHLRVVPQPLVEDASLRLAVSAADGGRLVGEPGDGRTLQSGTLSETRDIVVELQRPTPTRWQRLRDWWDSPVELS